MVLVAVHLVPPGDQDLVTNLLNALVNAAIPLVSAAIPIWNYISSRAKLKAPVAPVVPVVVPVTPAVPVVAPVVAPVDPFKV